MEQEIGRVIGTRPGHARIEVTQSCVCSHCELESSCVHGTGGTRIIEAVDPLGVSVDQRVQIELSSGGLIGASFIAYMVPVAALFIGALAGFYVTDQAPDMWAGVGALAGLGVGVMISRTLGRWFGRRGKLVPKITNVVTEDAGG